MEFCFLRARKTLAASGALALVLTGTAGTSNAWAQATPAPQQGAAAAGGQPAAAGKNWKDRDEYDLYVKISQMQDPKQQITLLQQWQDKYPNTDFSAERNTFWLLALSKEAGSDPQAAQQLITKSNDVLKTDPKNFRAAYFITLYGPRVGGASPSPELQGQVDTAAHTVLDNLPPKPANMDDAAWAKAKSQIMAVADNALAWDATSKKDPNGQEEAYKASLTADPTQAGISAAYAKALYEEKKVPAALYEYARAGSYDGPGALPDAAKQQALNFFKTEYKNYHGSDEGADQILTQAKTTPLPPDGFSIVSANDLANKEADTLNQRISADPSFKMWYAVKQNLQDKGDSFFDGSVKDVEIPGGAEGVKTFSGTIVSLDPADHPTKAVLGVEDPTKPDATLLFSQPLGTEALDKMKVGQKIDFSGVAESYTKDPYMLTFKDPTIPGVKTTAPAKTGHRRGK